MREPDWANMGYHADGYGAECEGCGEVAVLVFGEDEKRLLSPKEKDADFSQEELYAFVFFWTLLKLERKCICQAQYSSGTDATFRMT